MKQFSKKPARRGGRSAPPRPFRKPQAVRKPQAEQGGAPGPVRLNKYLADHGVGSRRRCDEVILNGEVSINGEVITKLGTRVDPANDRVAVNGRALRSAARVIYALNKPAGVVCTNSEMERRPRAIDLVKDPNGARLFCVGRLDLDSEGLIILTNDGEFANRIAHPKFGVTKSYFVRIRGLLTPEALEKIQKGVWLSEGRTQGARVMVRKRLANATVVLVTVREGMNREIRRIFAKLGFMVEHLKRVAIGPVSVRGIGRGRFRKLLRKEVELLLESAAADEAGVEPSDAGVADLHEEDFE